MALFPTRLVRKLRVLSKCRSLQDVRRSFPSDVLLLLRLLLVSQRGVFSQDSRSFADGCSSVSLRSWCSLWWRRHRC
jgi:hypothetical protein